MGLLDFFKKPKWKNSNSKVRLAAVDDMSVDDLETLVEIIREDSDQQVRLTALMKVDDRKSMESLLEEELPEEIIAPARERLEAIYTDLIISGSEDCIPEELLALITNQNFLAGIAVEADTVDLRCLAVAAIDDPGILYELLKKNCGKKPALAAVGKIDDAQMLAEIAEKAVNKSARSMAERKLRGTAAGGKDNKDFDSVLEPAQDEQTALDQDDKKEEHGKIRAEKNQKRQELCAQVESLCKEIGEKAEARFAEIEKKWPADDPEVDDEELLTLQKHYEEVCNIFYTTLNELKNEKQNMENLTASCGQIEKFLEDDNLERTESLLKKNITELQSMAWRWLDPDGIAARFSACQGKLEQKKEKLAEIARAEKEKLQLFVDVCVEMEELVTFSDRYQAEKKARSLNESWEKLPGKSGKQYDEFAERFQSALDNFWKKQKQFYKEQEWQLWNNKTKKEELCTIVELLKEDSDLHQVSRKLKEYQAAWKEIGQVPKKDSNELWDRFKSVCDENYARCRVFYTELDQKRRESLVIKEGLCARAEEHVASTKWKESADVLKGLQKEWKEAGPGERNKEQVLYKRFRKACDQFFDRRSVSFAEQDAERKDNLLVKEKLCQDVEDLVQEPKMDHGKLIRDLQKSWKEIGPVPRKNDQEIWKRFRGACDTYYNWLDEQRVDNLQQKIALCEQVEAFQSENEDEIVRKETVEKIVELQKQWKTIGPVPRKEADTLWERFTSQCDTFFATRKIRMQEEESNSLENQSLKETLLQRAGEVIQQQDEKEITVQLQDLQKEWKQIGSAPREQEQLLWDEFQGLCSAFFQQKENRYKEKKSVLDENLKKKEELCFQLERLAGKGHDLGNADKEGGIDLIEQFKIARETNFLLAGKTESSQKKKEEVGRIQQEWKALGSTYREHEQRLWKRYRKAIDLFFVN